MRASRLEIQYFCIFVFALVLRRNPVLVLSRIAFDSSNSYRRWLSTGTKRQRLRMKPQVKPPVKPPVKTPVKPSVQRTASWWRQASSTKQTQLFPCRLSSNRILLLLWKWLGALLLVLLGLHRLLVIFGAVIPFSHDVLLYKSDLELNP